MICSPPGIISMEDLESSLHSHNGVDNLLKKCFAEQDLSKACNSPKSFGSPNSQDTKENQNGLEQALPGNAFVLPPPLQSLKSPIKSLLGQQHAWKTPEQLPPAVFSKVVVIVSDNDVIWVQLHERKMIIEKITKDLNNLAKENKLGDCVPELGMICACAFMDGESSLWCRAKVVSLTPLRIQYFDYGNVSAVNLSDLRALPESFTNIAAQAFKIKFSDDLSRHYEEGTLLFVQPILKSSDGSTLVKMKGEVVEDLQLPNKKRSISPTFFTCTDLPISQYEVLPSNTFTKVVVMNPCESNKEFNVQTLEGTRKLAVLSESLQSYCSSAEMSRGLYKVGDYVAAMFTDNEWYRAQVQIIHPLTVLYVDFGDIHSVETAMLRLLPKEYKSMPRQVIRVGQEEGSKGFKFSEDNEILVKPIRLKRDGCVIVEAQQVPGTTEQKLPWIAQEGIGLLAQRRRGLMAKQEEFCAELDQEELNAQKQSDMIAKQRERELLALKRDMIVKEERKLLALKRDKIAKEEQELLAQQKAQNLRDLDAQQEESLAQQLRDLDAKQEELVAQQEELLAQQLRDRIAMQERELLAKQMLQIPVVKLAPNVYTEVKVVSISGVKDYWVNISENAVLLAEQLDQMMTKLGTFAPCVPKLDLLVAALFEGGWYRAKVTSLTPLKVLFIDFGNEELTVPNQIRMLSEEFTKLPVQAFKIILKDGTSSKYMNLDAESTLKVKPINMLPGSTIKVEVEEELPEIVSIPMLPMGKIELPENTFTPMKITVTGIRDYWLTTDEGLTLSIEMKENIKWASYGPSVGDVVASKEHAEGEELYRAHVLSVSSSSAKLFFIDFGNVAVLPLHAICQLPPKFMALKAQGVKVQLKEGTSSKFLNLAEYSELSVKRVGKNQDISIVEVQEQSYKPIELPPNVFTTVHFSDKAGGSWIQIHESQTMFEIMEEFSNDSDSLVPCKDVHVGALVSVLFEDVWSRAEIITLEPQIEVFFIDFGNKEIVRAEHIRALPKKYLQFSAQAVRISFSPSMPPKIATFEAFNDEFNVKPIGQAGDGSIIVDAHAN